MNTRLYRSPDDRVLAGVAGGMAQAYDLDPALVRIGWALLIVATGGLFLLVYIVMAIVVPLRPFASMNWSLATPAGAPAGFGDPLASSEAPRPATPGAVGGPPPTSPSGPPPAPPAYIADA